MEQKEYNNCCNYVVLSSIVMSTVMSMRRFSKIPHDVLINKVYSRLKAKSKSKTA